MLVTLLASYIVILFVTDCYCLLLFVTVCFCLLLFVCLVGWLVVCCFVCLFGWLVALFVWLFCRLVRCLFCFVVAMVAMIHI